MAKKETGKKNTRPCNELILNLNLKQLQLKQIAGNYKFPAICLFKTRLRFRGLILFIMLKIFDSHAPTSRTEHMNFAG